MTDITAAAAEADRNPSDAQKTAGNYKKGHISLHGLEITIENAKGSVRSGKDGKKWTVTMPAHYGYIKGTKGADDDHIDVYIGPSSTSGRVFLVDQVDAVGRHFDEHKAMLGFLSKEHALRTFHRAFSDGKGPARVGAVSTLTLDEFKHWLETGDHTHQHAKLVQHFADGGAVEADPGDGQGEDDWQPVQQAAPAQNSQSQGEDDWQPVGQQSPGGQSQGEDDWQPVKQLPASSTLGAAARSFARGVIPTLASIPAAAAGAVGGAALGTAIEPGSGTLVGGVGGALALGAGAGFLTSSAQDWVADKLGIDSPEQREADVTQHPRASFLGGLAPALLAFSPGKIAQQVAPEGANLLTRAAMTPAGQRVIGAAGMGGLEAGQEAANGDFDIEHILESAGFGAVAARPTRLGRGLIGAGESAAGRFVPGRPDLAAPGAAQDKQDADNSVPPNVARGASESKPAPQESPATTGNPDSAPVRSDRTYPKTNQPVPPSSGGSDFGSFNLPADQMAALDALLGTDKQIPVAPRNTGEPALTPTPPQAPIDTGIEQAAGAGRQPPPAAQEAPELQHEPTPTETKSAVPGEPPAGAEPQTAQEASDVTHPHLPDVRIDKSKQIPYLAGSSNDGRTVYGDPAIPDRIDVNGKVIDPMHPLAVHEIYERHGMSALERANPEMDRDTVYNTAHEKVGTAAEEAYLREYHGFNDKDIERYQQIMHELAAKTEKERPGEITPPNDLFTKPYPAAEAAKLHEAAQRPPLGPFAPAAGDDVLAAARMQREAAERTQKKAAGLDQPAPEGPLNVDRPARPQSGGEPVGAEPTAPAAPVERPSDSAPPGRVLPDLTQTPAPAAETPTKTPALQQRARVGNLEGAPIASGEVDARNKARAVDAAQHAFDASPSNVTVPVSKADRQAFVERMKQAVTDATEANFGTDPSAYKPRTMTPAQMWLRDAKRFANSKALPTTKRIQEFLANEKLLRNGGAADVRATNRVEGDIARRSQKTGSGDEAIERAENLQAKSFPTDFPGEDIPERDVHPEVQAEGAKGDIEGRLPADLDLEHLTPEKLDEIAKSTGVVAENLANPSLARVKAGEAPKASEGAASAVRKIEPTADLKAKYAQMMTDKADAVKRAADAYLPQKKSLAQALGDFAADENGSINLPRLQSALKLQRPRYLKDIDNYFGVARNDPSMIMEFVTGKGLAGMSQSKNSLEHATAAMWKTFTQKANPHDVTVFLHGVETFGDDATKFKQLLGDLGVHPDKHDWMDSFRPMVRRMLDHAYDMDVASGAQYAYRDNYMQHVFEDQKGFEQWLKQHIQTVGQTAFQKERTFDTYMQAEAAGFKRKFDNPADILSNRMSASFWNMHLMDMLKDLKSMDVAHLIDGTQPKSVAHWPRVQAPGEVNGAKQWAIDPTAYHIWDNAIQKRDLWARQDAMGDAFRAWMQAKAIWVPLKLSLSAFHPIHIIGVNLAQNFAREAKTLIQTGGAKGSLMRGAAQSTLDPILATKWAEKLPFIGDMALNFEGKKVRNIHNKPVEEMTPYERRVNELYRLTGSIPQLAAQDQARMEKALIKAVAENKYIKVLPLAAARVVEKLLQGPIFNNWIPNLKAAQTVRNIAATLERNPELMQDYKSLGVSMREIGKNMDDRFGEMFYDTLNWAPYLKNIGQGSMLSLGWQFYARQVYGAAANPVKSYLGAGGDLAQTVRNTTDRGSYILSYTGASMAAAGLISWAMSGKAPTQLMDYFFPQSGFQNPDGSDHRMTTMFNTREFPMAYYHAQESNSVLAGLGQMLYNKMIISPLVDAWHNKDFFGNELADPQAPWYKYYAQLIDSTLGNQLSPISAAGIKRTDQQGGTMRDKIMSVAGFGPAPAYVSRDKLGNRVAYLYDKYVPHTTPYERGGSGLISGITEAVTGQPQNQVEARRAAQADLNRARALGDPQATADAIKRLAATGIKPQTAAKMQPGQQNVVLFSKLPAEVQRSLVKEMTPDNFKNYVLGASPIRGMSRTKLIEEWQQKLGRPMP